MSFNFSIDRKRLCALKPTKIFFYHFRSLAACDHPFTWIVVWLEREFCCLHIWLQTSFPVLCRMALKPVICEKVGVPDADHGPCSNSRLGRALARSSSRLVGHWIMSISAWSGRGIVPNWLSKWLIQCVISILLIPGGFYLSVSLLVLLSVSMFDVPVKLLRLFASYCAKWCI